MFDAIPLGQETTHLCKRCGDQANASELLIHKITIHSGGQRKEIIKL